MADWWFSMLKKTNLTQIAEYAGVSISTVDRVLNQRGGVSKKREELVLEWATKLGLDRASFRSFIKTIKVAVLLEPTKNPFFKELKASFEDLSGIVPNVSFQCFFHYVDVQDLTDTASKIPAIAQRYDALIILAPDEPVLANALAQATQLIPVVTMVTDIPQSGRIAYVGPDNRQMGRTAGELMGRFIGKDGGNVLVVLGLQRFVGHEEREMGFRSVLRDRFRSLKIVDCLESSEDSITAGKLVSTALDDDPSIRGIYNVSAGNTQICNAIADHQKSGEIVLITHELTPDRRILLREGKIDAILDQNPRLEIQRAYEVISQYLDSSRSEPISNATTQFNIFLSESC